MIKLGNGYIIELVLVLVLLLVCKIAIISLFPFITIITHTNHHQMAKIFIINNAQWRRIRCL